MALKDTLAKLAAQQAAIDEYERSKPKLIEELQQSFESLVTMVSESLNEFVQSGQLGLIRRESSVEKPSLGVFQAKALTIRVIDRQITLTPISGDFVGVYAVAEFHLQESHNKAEVCLIKDPTNQGKLQWCEKVGASGPVGRGLDTGRPKFSPLTPQTIENIIDRMLQ
ncbi:MAG: hypothetical protein ACRYG8_25575 [Janthinobacterium lividum]